MHTSSLRLPPPPQVNPSWLCYPVLMSVRSPLLPCSALFLTASQTHAVTQPRSACLLAAPPLGPSAFSFPLCSSPPPQRPMARPHAASSTPTSRHTHLPAVRHSSSIFLSPQIHKSTSREPPRKLTWPLSPRCFVMSSSSSTSSTMNVGLCVKTRMQQWYKTTCCSVGFCKRQTNKLWTKLSSDLRLVSCFLNVRIGN